MEMSLAKCVSEHLKLKEYFLKAAEQEERKRKESSLMRLITRC